MVIERTSVGLHGLQRPVAVAYEVGSGSTHLCGGRRSSPAMTPYWLSRPAATGSTPRCQLGAFVGLVPSESSSGAIQGLKTDHQDRQYPRPQTPDRARLVEHLPRGAASGTWSPTSRSPASWPAGARPWPCSRNSPARRPAWSTSVVEAARGATRETTVSSPDQPGEARL